jgi:hypothetical protein
VLFGHILSVCSSVAFYNFPAFLVKKIIQNQKKHPAMTE